MWRPGWLGRVILAIGILALAAWVSLAQDPIPAQDPSKGVGVPSGMQTGQPGVSRPVSGNVPAALGSDATGDTVGSPFPDTTRQKRNDDRQRRLVADTEKLLVLTRQLKAELAGGGGEPLSPQMIKQMEEIEKLAKSVKEKMRD